MIYVHIPLCRSFCRYCDFYSEVADDGLHARFEAALLGEIRSRRDEIKDDPDAYIRVTFRTANGAEYISSIQSLGLPETALPSGGASSAPGEPPAAEPTLPPVETTTEKKIVITWD